MAPAGRRPRWEDLPRDLLVSIFAKVGVEDLIAGAPLACTAWRDAARDPRCWGHLDFQRWGAISRRLRCRREPSVDLIGLLDFAVGRARGSVYTIRFPDFADEIDLLFVAERCPALRYFYLENDDIAPEQFCKAISKLGSLEGMAVHERLICEEVLQHIRHSCISFSELEIFARFLDQDVAAVICAGLPGIRKLTLKDCHLSKHEIMLLLDKLQDLECLDISGYYTPGITREVLEKASRLKEFKWDSKFLGEEFVYCSGCDDDVHHMNPCECMFYRQVMEWLATE